MTFHAHNRPKAKPSAGLLLGIASLAGAIPAQGGAQTYSIAQQADPFRGLQNVSVEYYNVTGTDEQSINASLSLNSPHRPDGSSAMAGTRYTSRYRPLQTTTKGVCKVIKLSFQPGAVVVLPRLSDPSSVPQRILSKWGPFIAGLKEHEAGHIRINYEHTHAFETALVGTSCRNYQAVFEAEFARLDALEKAYDRDTNSGATQGAVLR